MGHTGSKQDVEKIEQNTTHYENTQKHNTATGKYLKNKVYSRLILLIISWQLYSTFIIDKIIL